MSSITKGKKMFYRYFLLLSLFLTSIIYSQVTNNKIFQDNTPNWVQTNGPGGGSISDLAINPQNPDIIYAVGIQDGVYKTTNGGELWELLPFDEPYLTRRIFISDNGILYSNYLNLSRSSDGGENWSEISNGFGEEAGVIDLQFDPDDNSNIYIVCDKFGNGGAVYKSTNSGDSWSDISGNLNIPAETVIDQIAVVGNGVILVAARDNSLTNWHKSRLFKTTNDGQEWTEINYGSIEDRFIFSLISNPNNRNEIWLTEGPLYNDGIDQPYIFKSTNAGNSWSAINENVDMDNTQMRVIGFDTNNRMYLAGGGFLSYSDNGGNSFSFVGSMDHLLVFDLYRIYPLPNNPNVVYLPTDAGGVAYSNDGCSTWLDKSNGITATSINLIASDPENPAVVYASSNKGEGIFRTDDYGQSWTKLNAGGIAHPFGDELTVDPSNPENVWFISDVPYIHKSTNRGNTWQLLNHPYQGNNFNFCSVYSMDIEKSTQTIFALNNGFGIFKGDWNGDTDFEWKFLNLSEIDYSYSIVVDQNNPGTIFSGYSKKPFETNSKIMRSNDGGENWEEALTAENTTAVTSVAIDNNNSSNVYAVSVGDNEASVWKSTHNGNTGTWNNPNPYFNFTTIHSFAANDNAVFAGVWGGGTYKSMDNGSSWQKIESEKVTSAAAIAIAPSDNNIVYAADRRAPILYKSNDNGITWQKYFEASSMYRRLMTVVVDPLNSDIVYVAAMKMTGPGKEGAIYKIENGVPEDITNGIDRVPLTFTVDPNDNSVIYTVLHESGVYKSVNGGESWQEISGSSSGLPVSGFNNLVIDPNNSDVIYLLGGCDVKFSNFASAGLDPDDVNGVYKSTDGGNTWENINNGVLGSASGEIKSLVFHENNSQKIYLASATGVYYSTDAGSSWLKSNGLPFESLGGICIQSENVYAFTNGAGVFTGTINSNGSISWNNNQKLSAPIAFAQVVVHPSNSSRVYASAYPGGIFRSDDAGLTWSEKNFGMASFSVDDPLRQGYYAISISQSNPDVIYLGLYEKGVYRSFNAGDTWYPVNGSMWQMYGKKITSILVDESDENKIYVGTEEGIFQTNNGGTDWFELSDGLASKDVKILRQANGMLLAGTKGYGLYFLDGSTWEPVNGFGNFGVFWPMWDDRPLYQYTSTLFHPYDSDKMLIGTFPQGIYKTTDGGNSWKESNINWTFDGVFELVTHPDNPNIVYSGTYNGLNRSLDFGDSWEMWDNGIPDEQWVFSIDFDPTNPDIMYACSKNGENEGQGREGFRGTVLKSTNGGETWFEIVNGLDKDQEYYKIIVDKFDHEKIYLASQSDGMFISEDAGNSWQFWNEGLTNKTPGTNGNNVTKMLTMSADNSILYFGSAGQGVFRRMIAPTLPVNNLGANINDNQVILNWQFDDINNNFGSYKIYRSTTPFSNPDGLSPITTISSLTTRTYNDNDIQAGVQYYYAVTTSDNEGHENKNVFVLGPVVDAGVAITSNQLPDAYVSENYHFQLEGTGGVAPYNWNLVDGSLPTGLELYEPTGELTGIPSAGGNYNFTLKMEDSQTSPYSDSQQFSLTVIDLTDIDEASGLPTEYMLYQNYPNPFNPETSIKYALPENSSIELVIYDLLGRTLKRVIKENQPAGYYLEKWNAADVTSGVYFYSIYTKSLYSEKSYRLVRKMMVVK